MRVCTTLMFLIALCSITLRTCGGVSLPFTREIILRNVGNVTIGATFNEQASSFINQAITPSVVTTISIATPPDAAIVASSWFTGTTEEVNKAISGLNLIFDTWIITPNDALTSNLNKLSLLEFGVQPRTIDIPSVCGYGGQAIGLNYTDFGFHNLSIVFSMQTDPSINLSTELCRTLSLPDCSLVTIDHISNLQNGSYRAGVRIVSSDRNEILIRLLERTRYASALRTQKIISFSVSGTLVYYVGDLPELSYEGDMESCLSHYWYIIFLLLIIPVVLLMGQRFYYCGEDSGRKSMRSMEWDIRGGVRYQGQMNAQYGGMQQTNFLPDARLSGQYVPQYGLRQLQNYGGSPQNLQYSNQYGNRENSQTLSQYPANQSGVPGLQNSQYNNFYAQTQYGQTGGQQVWQN